MARKGRKEDRERNNIVNIDGSKGDNPKATSSSGFRPIYAVFSIIIIILIYLIAEMVIISNKHKAAIYEVQKEALSFDYSFDAVAVREEQLVYTPHSGYISYFVNSGKKAARNASVFSIDTTRNIYTKIKEGFSATELSEQDVSEVKELILDYISSYDGSSLKFVSNLESDLTGIINDKVNANMLESVETFRTQDGSNSFFYLYYTPVSGVISYTCDSLTGLTSEKVDAETFTSANKNSYTAKNLKISGLIGEGTPVYRICSNENWSLISKISEPFFLDNIETDVVSVYIGGAAEPVQGSCRFYERNGSYFCEIFFDRYMSEYINERYTTVEFVHESATGLKIPATAIVTKQYYLIPLSVFCEDENYEGNVMKVAKYDETTGEESFDSVYQSKYYSDGYYAYIDLELLTAGDYIANPETGERVKIGLVNELEGVYNVNKGYYQFTRIERMKQNDEYVIVRSDTVGGLRQYDHIAYNGSDAVDAAIIY